MPRYSKNRISKRTKGGGIITTPVCAQQVDVARYIKPCGVQNVLPLDNIFMKHFPQQGGKKHTSKHKNNKHKNNKHNKSGGGFSILPDVNIGNLPEIRGYNDCCPPVLLKNGPVWSNNFQPLCGQKGGNAKSGKKNKRTKKNSQSGGKTHRNKTSKKTHKNKNNRKHKGGGIQGMSSVNGNFSPDMTTREFGCKQPYWTPNCV